MKNLITYNNINFDSNEELEFYYYLEELKEAGYINNFEYNTKCFILSTPYRYKWKEKLKTKEIEKESTLLQGHEYTTDYYIEWNKKAEHIFYEILGCNKNLSKAIFIAQLEVLNEHTDQEKYTGKIISNIEIKPSFDYQNMTRLSVLNQKWTMTEYGVYVQKIIPTGKNNCLFAKTFVPQKALFTKKKKQPKKFKYAVKSLQEFINSNDIKS
jgi:hypothetical protein